MNKQRILVPRLLDCSNFNAQNLNARALLSRFRDQDLDWSVTWYDQPDATVVNNPRITAIRLWRRRMWLLRLWLFYLQPATALFYPGREAVDAEGLRWSRRLYPKRPLIATIEGLAGTAEREQQLSAWAGHPVYCQRVSSAVMARVDAILASADHIIAISPFLADMGSKLYGDKFSVLPLGIDTHIFYPPVQRANPRMRVVSAGRLAAHKRPELLFALAERHPSADFIWYGDGELREALQQQAVQRKLSNLFFPGALAPENLAEAFRAADIFVMPSLSEGVPKVTQEAAACGLPIVVFGFYHAPSVKNGKTGHVVWSDDEFYTQVAALLADRSGAAFLGASGAQLALSWDWDVLAPQWEARIKQQVRAVGQSSTGEG
jgi:glycosyltransferase involved in cell wall biosynthesis